MPIIDEDREVLVLRVVYDGPPFSGKTTTLRTLSRGLGVDIVTPEERAGRTLAFDWVDYTGGLFEGRKIRCQIVSVPGQPELARRRRYLIESADAIVVVADTRRTEVRATFSLLRDLLGWASRQEPPVGIVLQANKRDEPNAVPRDELHAGLAELAPLGLIETVATSGHGVREAFVFGVRLALDRVRALSDAGALAHGRPAIDSAAQLHETILGLGDGPPPGPPPPFSPPADAAEVPSLAFAVGHIDRLRRYDIEDEPTFRPDATIPGGFIWPPVEGRALLDEASRQRLAPVRTAAGDWAACGELYRLHSARASRFEDVDAGRAALIRWARVHAAHLASLSPRRVLVLAEAGQGRHRLWQLVRIERTLRERLALVAMDGDPLQVAFELAGASAQLLRARAVLHTQRLPLACTLDTVGHDWARAPVFVGIVPEQDDEQGEELEGAALVQRELAPFVRGLADDRGDFAEIASELRRVARREAPRPGLGELARLALEVDARA